MFFLDTIKISQINFFKQSLSIYLCLFILLMLLIYALYIFSKALAIKNNKQSQKKWNIKLSIYGTCFFVLYSIMFIKELGTSINTNLNTNNEKEEIALVNKASENPIEIEKGKKQFAIYCAQCHNANASGNIGPNLTDEYWIHGANFKDYLKVIEEGVPLKGMISWSDKISKEEIIQIASFIKSIQNTNVKGKEPQGFFYTLKNDEYIKDETVIQKIAEVTIPDDIPKIGIKGNLKHGQELFNAILGCAHCHGTDAIGHLDNRNLRQTKNRYGKNYSRMIDMLLFKGRDGTAMPPWSHLKAKDLEDVKSFVMSIQDKK